MNCRLCKKSKNIVYVTTKNNYQYFLCKNCRTLFLYPIPSQKEINNYYKNFSYVDGMGNEKNIRKRARKILKKLKIMNTKGTTLLDIGSGLGYLIDEANKVNIKSKGIEPSKKLFRYIDISNKIANCDFDEYFKTNKNDRFDFITLIHVIEHVPKPKEFLDKVATLLNKNGILYIETPNLDSHLFNAEKTNYTFLTPPEHLYIFSKRSFNYVQKLKSTHISTYSHSEHFMGILKSLIKTINKNSNPQVNSFKKIENTDIRRFNIKFFIFDLLLARIFTPVLNLFDKGSILELYYNKK